jgi:hypothetical protein
VRVEYADPDPDGLAWMLGELIRQNVEQHPERERLLRPSLVSIAAIDAGAGATLRLGAGRVLVTGQATARAPIALAAGSDDLLRLTASPLRFGLPDVLSPQGREVLGAIASGRVRVKGMFSHPVRLARLTMLLSVH